ncbi:MAG: hypothetical protein M3325_06180, partial [Actinomycetota bacterium]|nr:hypothetical protein [Actinomycetota bacterium]
TAARQETASSKPLRQLLLAAEVHVVEIAVVPADRSPCRNDDLLRRGLQDNTGLAVAAMRMIAAAACSGRTVRAD